MTDRTEIIIEVGRTELTPYLSHAERNKLLAAGLLSQRAALRRKLYRLLAMSLVGYAALCFSQLVRGALNAIGSNSADIASSSLTVGAEPGAVIVTALITASISFNVILNSWEFRGPFDRRVPLTASDIVAFASSAQRALMMETIMQGIAVVAGIVGLAVSFHGIDAGTLDVVGSSAVALTAVATALLSVQTSEHARLARVRVAIAQLDLQEEVGHLVRAYRYWAGLEDRADADVLAAVEADPPSIGLRKWLLARASMLVVSMLPPAILLAGYYTLSSTVHAASLWRLLALSLYLGSMSYILLYVVVQCLRFYFSRDWASLGLFATLLFVLLLTLLSIAIEALLIHSWLGTLVVFTLFVCCPLGTVTYCWRDISRRGPIGEQVARMICTAIHTAYRQKIPSEGDAPSRQRFRRTRNWFRRRAGEPVLG